MSILQNNSNFIHSVHSCAQDRGYVDVFVPVLVLGNVILCLGNLILIKDSHERSAERWHFFLNSATVAEGCRDVSYVSISSP